MRQDFVRGLCHLAERDDRVVLLTADLGFGTIEPFIERFPDRFINVGVAEQNLIGVATGLAQRGLLPYCYSIASFAVGRTWEFPRNGPVAHGLTMGLVGIGPGFDYGVDGHTHHAIEDIALIRSLNRARIIAPADGRGAEQFASTPLPESVLTYFRLARHGAECPTERWSDGTEPSARTVILSLGEMWPRGSEIERALRSAGINAEHFVVEELGDGQVEAKFARLSSVSSIVAVESHRLRGGLASSLAEQLAQVGWSGRIRHIGPMSLATEEVGDERFLWDAQVPSIESTVQWAMSAPRLKPLPESK